MFLKKRNVILNVSEAITFLKQSNGQDRGNELLLGICTSQLMLMLIWSSALLKGRDLLLWRNGGSENQATEGECRQLVRKSQD